MPMPGCKGVAIHDAKDPDAGTDKPVVLVTGIAGFIGFHLRQAAAGRGAPGRRHRQPQRLLRRGAEAGPPAPARFFRGEDEGAAGQGQRPPGRAGAGVLQGRPAGPGKDGRHLCRRKAAAGGAPGRPGRGALLAGEPLVLRGQQHHRLHEHPGELPPPPGAPPGLRLLLVGLRGQPGPALRGEPQRRPPPLALRRQQEGQRADGPQLFPPVRHPGHRPALLHRLRPLGPPRHGPVHLHPPHPGRQSRSRSTTTAT